MAENADSVRFSYKYANRFAKVVGSEASNRRKLWYRLATLTIFVGIWQVAAWQYHSDLLLPGPLKVLGAFFLAVIDPVTLSNLALTLRRVLLGLAIAGTLGMSLGFAMGYSRTVMQLVDPIINPLRQVPIMAWVPLTIVWFGLGDGPTLFLIAMVSVFPILLSTVSGVHAINRDFYNAGRSMGASFWSLFRNVIIPGSLPEILTGVRVAVSAGWMSVI